MAATPPTHPIYNIKFSRAKITYIISRIFPDREIGLIEQLETGKHFNNRIYYIKLNASANLEPTDLVLKISGRGFGPRKIQNEVRSLFLLEHYCPDVSSPKVHAWCCGDSRSGAFVVIRR